MVARNRLGNRFDTVALVNSRDVSIPSATPTLECDRGLSGVAEGEGVEVGVAVEGVDAFYRFQFAHHQVG